MSVNSTSPATLFGGTWVAWGSGRVPVGVNTGDTSFNTVEKTGGAKTVALSINNIPKHGHNMGSIARWSASGMALAGGYNGTTVEFADNVHTAEIGSGTAHNNLQPYITCYMWKRTA